MRQYLDLVRRILDEGSSKTDPHGVGNFAVCGAQLRFNLAEGFPLITTRSLKGSWRGIVEELLWVLSGSTNVADLRAKGIHFWDEWGKPERTRPYGREPGQLGPLYGHQWRNFGASRNPDGSYNHDGVDQISRLISGIEKYPDNRRLRVVNWNPDDFNDDDWKERVFIAPCHGDFQIIHLHGKLHMHHVQRSGDVPIGIPFNIAEYALLLLMITHVTGYEAGELVHTISDAHIYRNQVSHMHELLEREPKLLPRVRINPEVRDIFGFRFEDFELLDYNPHPLIKDIPVAP